jgi:hypothetical protein
MKEAQGHGPPGLPQFSELIGVDRYDILVDQEKRINRRQASSRWLDAPS